MEESGEKLTDEKKEPIIKKIQEVRDEISNKNIENIKKTLQELQDLWNPIVTDLYGRNDTNSGDINNFMNNFGKGNSPFAV
jgi:hypothetical protein